MAVGGRQVVEETADLLRVDDRFEIAIGVSRVVILAGSLAIKLARSDSPQRRQEAIEANRREAERWSEVGDRRPPSCCGRAIATAPRSRTAR
jgi:hypothetical protein